MLKTATSRLALGLFLASQLALALPAAASSHMDAPLISLDDAANTTDVYAFRTSQRGIQYLTTALAVYPFEEPGIGPNNYRFDPDVDYEIHVALDGKIAQGRPDLTYRFEFQTRYANPDTILQTYLGVLTPNGGDFPTNQNLRQTYTVTKIDNRTGTETVIAKNYRVPPNNQGRVTPAYNTGNNGDNPAKAGATRPSELDDFTKLGVRDTAQHYWIFAGQRDDGFYGDIQSIFDLDFSFDKPEPFDSQGGSNVHTIVLNIPLTELGSAENAGVYATTSRPTADGMKQVARQGNPLFVEALIANKDKDKYNRSKPAADAANFTDYAANPQISALLGVTPLVPGLLEQIFIPDLIKVDLTTGPVKLAGQAGFHRLSVFGGDTVASPQTGGNVAGGWPNGRRFGDDVIDIAVIALGAAGTGPDFSDVDVDKVTGNDITYNQVFPFAATPLNGRNHQHHN